MLFALLAACTTQQPTMAEGELVFVRDAVILPGVIDGGQIIGDNRSILVHKWAPGEKITLGGHTGTAPARPECRPLFHVPLSDVSRLAASGGVAPNSAVAFSPSGDRLAIGSFQGDLVVVDGWTGQELARTVLPEAITKRLAWSSDGLTLYAGEQSPDAVLHALDPQTLKSKWAFRAADFVHSSPLPEGEDRYAIFDLPGIYTMKVLENGDLFVVAVHGWNDSDGTRNNASQVFRLNGLGEVIDRWPDKAVSATFLHTRVHEGEGSGSVLINLNRSASGPAPEGLPFGGLAILDLATLSLQSTASIEPLAPWFKAANLWQAMDYQASKGLFVGMGDGRVMLKEPAPPHATRVDLSTGIPIMAGKVPIAASVGFGLFAADTLMYTTSDTNIPWGAAVGELRPPTHHPGANGLWVADLAGKPLWSWQGDLRIQGLSISPSNTLGVIGGGHRSGGDAPPLYGAMVFDLSTPNDGRSGSERRVSTCVTSNPVYFSHQVLDDGRIAVIQFPIPDGKGGITGSYRATVLR
jgi:hypothetical protein